MDLTVGRPLDAAVRETLCAISAENASAPAYAAIVEAAMHAATGRMRLAQTCLTESLNMLGEGEAATRSDEIRAIMGSVDGGSVQACVVRSALQVALKIAEGVCPRKIASSYGSLHYEAGQVARAVEMVYPLMKAA